MTTITYNFSVALVSINSENKIVELKSILMKNFHASLTEGSLAIIQKDNTVRVVYIEKSQGEEIDFIEFLKLETDMMNVAEFWMRRRNYPDCSVFGFFHTGLFKLADFGLHNANTQRITNFCVINDPKEEEGFVDTVNELIYTSNIEYVERQRLLSIFNGHVMIPLKS